MGVMEKRWQRFDTIAEAILHMKTTHAGSEDILPVIADSRYRDITVENLETIR